MVAEQRAESKWKTTELREKEGAVLARHLASAWREQTVVEDCRGPSGLAMTARI